jgi:hypothetical protein
LRGAEMARRQMLPGFKLRCRLVARTRVG